MKPRERNFFQRPFNYYFCFEESRMDFHKNKNIHPEKKKPEEMLYGNLATHKLQILTLSLKQSNIPG